MVFRTDKNNRQSLTNEQKDVLFKLAPLSVTISQWVDQKCKLLDKKGHMFPSLILADILVESEFLNWPLSKEFQGNTTKRANNLTRIKADNTWTGKTAIYEEEPYRVYNDWVHFGSDYSDILTFSNKYDAVLTQPTIEAQIKTYSKFKPNPKWYNGKVSTLIQFYWLGEVDG